MSDSKKRWERYIKIALGSMKVHKYNHFNLIQAMNRKELHKFIDDRKYLNNVKTNSKMSEIQRKDLSMVTYANNLLRLRS